MKKPNLEELAKMELAQARAADPALRVVVRIMRLLVDGDPVPPLRIASSLQIFRDEATAVVSQFGAELDEAGNVAGLGVSLTPTPHRYVVNGRNLYTWCATDAMSFPILYRHTALIESPDPISG